MKWKQTGRVIFGAVLVLLALPAIALAAQSSSSHYQVNEVFIGAGGEEHACSGNTYCAKETVGEIVNGKACSDNLTPTYCSQAGFNTDRQPYIQFTVSNTNVNLGNLSQNLTKTATAAFSIKAYLSHGYTVITASDPPKNTSYTMNALTTPTASAAGVEQFGMNLVANTVPANFGANPVQSPDSSFGFGLVDVDYSSPNLYKYQKGDTIAHSVSSTSSTTYTISYIFNMSNVTPGGVYAMNHVLVATATY